MVAPAWNFKTLRLVENGRDSLVIQIMCQIALRYCNNIWNIKNSGSEMANV